jgi:hypothetical protein
MKSARLVMPHLDRDARLDLTNEERRSRRRTIALRGSTS